MERFESDGVEALLQEQRGRLATLLVGWAVLLVRWVRTLTPRDFGYFRSRRFGATRALTLLSALEGTLCRDTGSLVIQCS